jgi:hypothetical protein
MRSDQALDEREQTADQGWSRVLRDVRFGDECCDAKHNKEREESGRNEGNQRESKQPDHQKDDNEDYDG